MLADRDYMAKALQLARLGLYSTSPNPRVGCVLVKDGEIIGEGWHQKAGEGHAEVNALRAAGKNAEGATAYVTLEPCSHFGRTPPCAKGLIDAGIVRVVGATTDPNPQVAGRGYNMLRDAGIEVVESCLQAEAEAINIGFMQRMRTGLPYVRAKLAQSLDGRTAMASGESQWITGPQARQDVQRLRARSCAIITGVDSVLIDDPSMTVRPEETGIEQEARLWRQPLRVVIDGQNRLPSDAKLLQQNGDILVATLAEPESKPERPANSGSLNYWVSPQTDKEPDRSKVDLSALMRYLGEQGHNEILVESGAQLAGAFAAHNLINELVLYCAPTLLGSNAKPLLSLDFSEMKQQIRWHWQDVRMVGNDLRLTLTPSTPAPEEN
ncbi:bifunctional diaminohydroxyphosphoribosylaminopyrimidine deaminase/5-amino-6-(5-phosphoribosylamino)uracil reductase RibD [Bacterioplanoides sp. SCSIO 12839]|uniref:bifunctional diaminohydroxyphosphoribosylaminopyrimidine deaminase/5-amino-6-(5-phosphoribosylamino)uracil reductase RibD n=1 Tax=Bacterioplanoides sp. SCSIO 12839 TaxID=2829569 RepID=UPI00210711FB|nr:bifunctional diaminohydroxyphosphoribosylaminopyrimidine deaminase/5-amino-6-(5-phosphoribosylamino)uracil reductase RibD [Bacterioplanoides sp. SCSIO 12839]UTW47592.1 bifunctional diaminohydroxyphosphoribosylaminopyrimidine deaminase/5-amino-6-(5-phosphoribosylamino)uracil reductase RibD [Bacterioplanoides sp. SCSIO 12839]